MLKEQEVFTAGALDYESWGNDFHELMLSCEIRMQAYRKAIFEVVKPGMVVCEVGAGTGILSQWALESGAKVVYAIESNVEVFKKAKRSLSKYGERFIAIDGLSKDITLPEKVDVLISELIGNVADNENFSPILMDAQARFLKANGMLLPIEVTSYITPIDAPEAHQNLIERNVRPSHADTRLVEKLAQTDLPELFNFYYDSVIPTPSYLSDPQPIESFCKNHWPSAYKKDFVFTVMRDGIFNGFKGWFAAKLSPTTTLSIESAEKPSLAWKHAYFPIERPSRTRKGDILRLTISRDASGKYAWAGGITRAQTIISTYNQKII